MSRAEAFLSLTCSSAIIGSTLVVSRIISTGKSIYCMQFFGMLIASVILLVLTGKEKFKKEIKGVSKRDYVIIFFQTLLGVVLFRVFIVYGVKLTKAMDAGVILSLTPIVTVILSVVFLKEKLGKREFVALFCAFIGVLIINLNGIQDSDEGSMRIIGNSMILLAVVGEASFVVFSKKTSHKISPLTTSLLVCLWGAFLFFPLAVYEVAQRSSFLRDLDFWLLTLYTGVVLTVVVNILWFRGIGFVSGTVAGVFNSLIPVSAIVLVFIFLGETMSNVQLAGLVFILTGVGLVVFSKEEEEDSPHKKILNT